MPTKETLTMELVFVEYREITMKDGRTFQMLELSNGMRSNTFTPPPADLPTIKNLRPGETVTATFSVDVMRRQYNIDLVSIA